MAKIKASEFIEKSFKQRDFHRFKEGEGIEEFIVEKSAGKEIDQFAEIITSSLNKNLHPLLEKILAPSLEVKHIREQGLRIWGKKENVALSELSIVEILNNLFIISDKEKFETALYTAGRKSALHFFDQFRDILFVENTQHIPFAVVDFMDLLGSFDTKSAWWEEIHFNDDGSSMSISIKRPFLRYPWFENNNHFYMPFISGYLLSLHNCCCDYLNLVSKINKWEFDSLIGVKAEIFNDPDPIKSNLKIFRTDISIDEFQIINELIYSIIEILSSEQKFDDSKEDVFMFFDQLIKNIEILFGEKLDINADILKSLRENHVRNSATYIIRNILYPLLNEVRIQYDDKRIAKLRPNK